MPADPETSREMGEIAGAIKGLAEQSRRLEQRIEKAWEDGREETRRVYQRIESHSQEAAEQARQSREAIGAVDRKISLVTAELHAHTAHDDERFARQDRAIDAAAKDRGRWWRALVGVAGGGGLGAAVARWLDGGGGT